MTLAGPELKPGDQAPDFHCVDMKLEPVTLESTGRTARLFSVVPSLDTPVCDAQTRRFNEEAAGLPGAEFYTISVDLPFAQRRYSNTFGIDRVQMLSDYQDVSFGRNYGTLIEQLRLDCRALFVIDAGNVIRHAEYVHETSAHPDYEAALKVLRKLSRTAGAAS